MSYALSVRIVVFSIIACILLSGCGRYAPPLPPEAFSPKAVEDLQVNAALGEISFQWRSPEEDRRGKELKFIDGYEIRRAEILTWEAFVDDPEESSVKVGFVPDTHIAERERLRDEAVKAGKSTRRVKVGEDLKQFRFGDRDLTPGAEYVYMIVPMNQDDVEGEIRQYVRVLYRGDSSQVTLVDQALLAGEL